MRIKKNHSTCSLFCLFILFDFYPASGQQIQWAGATDGPEIENTRDIAVDQHQNVIAVGWFETSVDFNFTTLNNSLLSKGSFDIFITKYTKDGKLSWAKSVGGADAEVASGVCTDAQNNIYVTGYFQDTVDFDPGIGEYKLVGSHPLTECYILKLDANGNFLWVKSIGWNWTERGNRIRIDLEGNVLVTGYFHGTVDFDPGPAIYSLTAQDEDAFILKLNANGIFLWAINIGGKGDEIGNDIQVDGDNNIYICGTYADTVDFDPGPGVLALQAVQYDDVFLAKYNSMGALIWAKAFGSNSYDESWALAVDPNRNVILTLSFKDTIDVDPGPDTLLMITPTHSSVALVKVNANGDLTWAKSVSATDCFSILTDTNANIYYGGTFTLQADFDPGQEDSIITSIGELDAFISKFDPDGNFIWAFQIGGTKKDECRALALGNHTALFAGGTIERVVDFEPGLQSLLLNGGVDGDAYIASYVEEGVSGIAFDDKDVNCVRTFGEIGIAGVRGLLSPGDLFVETNFCGKWFIDSLAAGLYSIIFDTSGYWNPACVLPIQFEIIEEAAYTEVDDVGFRNTLLCASPSISVSTEILRRCDNKVFRVELCNLISATAPLINPIVRIEVDPFIIVNSFSLPYSEIDPNVFIVELDTIDPSECVQFKMNAQISCDAITDLTLCVRVELVQPELCYLEEAETLATGLPPCAYDYDQSHLELSGFCQDEKIHFVMSNTAAAGIGDMTCYSRYHIYVDGKKILEDSIRLPGGGNQELTYTGDGRTWRVELEQHPLHPGRYNPSTSVELCGNSMNWTPGMVNVLAQDDQNAFVDFFCNVVRNSYDPNDKTGFPLGVGIAHDILPESQLEYLIRFQNTGNDTAFNIIIRDTLSSELEIFSVRPGVSSHSNSFKIYGPRVLEWTFENILLPDSIVDEKASHGFVTFKIDLVKGLPGGTLIPNDASIYFDYNEPIKTNTSIHRISERIKTISWTNKIEISGQGCHELIFRDLELIHSGTYWILTGGLPDTLIQLNVDIVFEENDLSVLQEGDVLIAQAENSGYQWMNCANQELIHGANAKSFNPGITGTYAVIITKENCIDTSACQDFVLTATPAFIAADQILLYPNPTFDQVTIEFEDQAQKMIMLRNPLGQTVYQSGWINASKEIINLVGPAGMYTLLILSEKYTWSIKVLKI